MIEMKFRTRDLCLTAMIAAIYATLTLGLQAISFGPVQFRVSEALTLLPILFPQAIPGLTLGCLISNLFSPLGATVYDVVFGTLATLVAAILTRRIKGSVWVKALPPVLANGVIVGLVLTYAYGLNTLWLNMLTVAAGEAAVCYALGVPMIKLLEKADLSRITGSPTAGQPWKAGRILTAEPYITKEGMYEKKHCAACQPDAAVWLRHSGKLFKRQRGR